MYTTRLVQQPDKILKRRVAALADIGVPFLVGEYTIFVNKASTPASYFYGVLNNSITGVLAIQG
jgi:hypothetical protein